MGNMPKAILKRDNSEHKSAQTDTTEVPHVGIQFEPHPPRDEEETQRKTCNQNLQSQMNNLSVVDDQLAPGSPVLKNEGSAQLGEGNSIVNNPTYNITYHNTYIIQCQPSSHHGNNQPCHIPCQCQECIQSYVNQHGNGSSRSESQHVSHSQQMESTKSKDNGTSRSEGGHVNHSQQIASTESRGNDQTKRPTTDQVSSPSRRLPPSDVIQHATLTERERAESETVNPEGGDCKQINQSEPSQNTGMRPPSVSVTHDTVCIIDSKGQVLEPGDALWTEGPGYPTKAIYIGHQMVVRCDRKTDNNMAKKEQLCMTAPFGKYTVISGECQVFPPKERVDRATAWIGKRYTGVDAYGLDFQDWVYTGLGWREAHDRKGFSLGW